MKAHFRTGFLKKALSLLTAAALTAAAPATAILDAVPVAAQSTFMVYTDSLTTGIGETKPIDTVLNARGEIYYYIHDSSIADCSWGHWHGSDIALYVTGKKEGSTIITFTNTVDSTSFDVPLIVSNSSVSSEKMQNLAAAYISYQSEITYGGCLGYFIYDINVDGIPELICRTGEWSYDEAYHFYSYDDGIQFSGDIEINHCQFYANGGAGLALCRKYMGTASRYDLTLDSSYKIRSSEAVSSWFAGDSSPEVSYKFTDTRYALEEHDPSDLSYLKTAFATYGFNA